MKRSRIFGTAAALALAAGASAGAVRSCSFERQETGFDAYIPLGEAKAGVSCTEWIGPSTLCMLGDLSGPHSIELSASARYGRAFAGMPVPFSGKRLEISADAKSKSVDIALENP
ncbi:MAG TPA: hypothetical protein VLD37_02665 [Candidatus Bilamarchaeum sp.]|nr:hypothetical protein [Candidatus Bilamarchaeum sp.]